MPDKVRSGRSYWDAIPIRPGPYGQVRQQTLYPYGRVDNQANGRDDVTANGIPLQPNILNPSAYNFSPINRNMPARPDLTPYAGPTSVNLSPQQRAILDLIGSWTTDPNSPWARQVSGQPNMSLLEMGVFTPMENQLRTQTLPQIADIYSGGPYGSGYWSGARQEAQARAVADVGTQQAQLSAQEAQAAQNRSIQAMQMLPSLMQAATTETQLQQQNIENAMYATYQNAGLSRQEFEMDMAATNAILNQDRMNLEGEQAAWNAQIQASNQMNDLYSATRGQNMNQQTSLISSQNYNRADRQSRTQRQPFGQTPSTERIIQAAQADNARNRAIDRGENPNAPQWNSIIGEYTVASPPTGRPIYFDPRTRHHYFRTPNGRRVYLNT